MEVWRREAAGSWMVPRSRGMAAAVALGAALTAVYAVLAALALTAPNALTVPSFGAFVRADAGSFTALLPHSSPPSHHTHVLAAVASVPAPAAAPVASAVSTPPVAHTPAPKPQRHHQALANRRERRHPRHE